jgi:D-arabinose 1-dehydrogenase-like Zn-dependent alcohol dehydrogenase
VEEKGSKVKRLNIGDRVGIGWIYSAKRMQTRIIF